MDAAKANRRPGADEGVTRLRSGSKGVIVGYIGMSPSKAEYFRASAEDCCRKAVIAEDIDHRSHP